MTAHPVRQPHAIAPIDQADGIARRLLPVLRSMVRAEVEDIRTQAPRAVMLTADADIMAACKRVAKAVDQLEQARFAGGPEIPARKALHLAAKHLRTVMQKHRRGG